MIWTECILYKNIQNGTDKLNNPTYELTEVYRAKARFTPWSAEQMSLEDREVTKTTELYALKGIDLPKCDYAEIEGVIRKVDKISNLSKRYTVLRVQNYKE